MPAFRAQRATFLFREFEMHAHNGEISPEDSVLFKRIEKQFVHRLMLFSG